MTLRSPGPAALLPLIILSLAACSPFDTRFKRVTPGVYHVESVQCAWSGDASAALADIAAEGERRCRGGHRLDDTVTSLLGTRGSVFGECPAARVTTTVTCLESTR
ncbi:hypothetical protein [Luteimonas sp. 3794]|uniref:hypothetical protein n=1 Tax=Luteimonas sp. 3794 TaxID=2817730 RepID=UPI00285B00D2|nr:hypothetical protein [Luteimonas sp. 3794]MDR6992512.1 hypothetical protein [Luteimonas sp. 3794]